MDQRVVIIGAGLTGLSAGIALREKGVDTDIFEMAAWPGGVCTAWERKGFTFDGCVHWMVGTREGEPIRALYERVGALESDMIIHHPSLISFEINGEMYDIPLEIQAFRMYLLELAPEDEPFIEVLCNRIDQVSKSRMLMGIPKNIPQAIEAFKKSHGFLMVALKYKKKSVEMCTKNIKSERLKQVIHHLMMPNLSMIALVMMLGTRMAQNGGYPSEGAKGIIQRMVHRYNALGGRLHFNARVDEIFVEKREVTGVRVGNQIVPATEIIAACDMHDLLYRMLNGQYRHPQLSNLLENGPLFPPIAILCFGLSKKFDIGFGTTYETSQPIEIGGGKTTFRYHIRSFDFEPNFAPEGKSSVMVMVEAPYEYWVQLRRKNIHRYNEEKQQLLEDLIAQIDMRVPGFRDAIEVTDVSTPATYHRYNNLYKGSYEGFLPVPDLVSLHIKPRIRGVRKLYLAGQWLKPGGGIPVAIMEGIEVANRIKPRH